ncbi:deoxyribose-phosphate aldolase [Kiritimatiellaeota bacterium B1221]|nr:deoxyribose-phosphate aldolase [Kiritimatiellaeota bacterium B1221]
MNPLSSYFDVAILKPDMSEKEVLAAVESCLPYQPCAFCVRPSDIPLLKPICNENRIGLCVVLGFPHGNQLTISKVDEAKRYISEGVDEIDMVCNIGWVKSGEWQKIREDISAVSSFTRPAGVLLKVIFETCFLTEFEIEQLVNVCVNAKADFVKTSTGFNGEGAQDEQVKLMLKTADHRIQVKPSGGISSKERAQALIEMGATRLGVGYKSIPVICGDANPDKKDAGY